MTVSPLEVFAGPAAALPAAVFLSIVVIAVYNFRFVRGSGLCVFLRFRSILGVLFYSLGSGSSLNSGSVLGSVDIFKFLLRKKGWLSFG